MKIKYERFDFAKSTVEERTREVDCAKVLAGNAFFQSLTKRSQAAGPKEEAEAN